MALGYFLLSFFFCLYSLFLSHLRIKQYTHSYHLYRSISFDPRLSPSPVFGYGPSSIKAMDTIKVLKTKRKLPRFDGKPHHFKTWRISFEGWLYLKGFPNLLEIETRAEVVHRQLERDSDEYKKWNKESHSLFYILHEVMPYNIKKQIENHTFEDGKASYLYITEHIASANKMRMLALLHQLKNLKMKDHEDPDIFASKYLDIVSSLKDGGHDIPEADQILELLDKLPASYAVFRDIQLLTPPKSVKDLQSLLHVWYITKTHSTNRSEKALTSFDKHVRQHVPQVDALTCWFCGKKGHKKSQCRDRLEKIKELDQKSMHAPPPRRTNARRLQPNPLQPVSNALTTQKKHHYAITARELIENRIELEPKKCGRKKSFRAASLCASNDPNWRNTLPKPTPSIAQTHADHRLAPPTTGNAEIEQDLGDEKEIEENGTNWRVHHAPGALAHTAAPIQAHCDDKDTQDEEKTSTQAQLVAEIRKKQAPKGTPGSRSATLWRPKSEVGRSFPAISQIQNSEFAATATLKQQVTTVLDDWILDDHVAADIQQHLGTPDMDLFASSESSKAASYIDKQQDAFKTTWHADKLYWINPPFSKYSRVVKKLEEDKSQAILIFPLLENASWLQPILQHTTTSLLLLPPVESNIFRNRAVKKRVQALPTFDVLATKVDFGRQKSNIQVLNQLPKHVALTNKLHHDTRFLKLVERVGSVASSPSKVDFLIDSGATSHMTSQKHLFKNLEKTQRLVEFGNGDIEKITGIGSIIAKARTKDGEQVSLLLTDVLYVPKLKKSLISLTKATENGARFKLLANHASFRLIDQEIMLHQGDDNMLYLPLSKDEELPSISMIYHERFGHPGREITHLLTQKYDNLNDKLEHSNDCDTCIRAKIKRTPFGKQHQRSTTPFEIVGTDLTGPFKTVGLNGEKYFQVFVDEATAAVKVYLLKYKSEVIKKLKKFIQQMRAPKILRSDNAKEFKSAAWKEVCRQHKIFLQYTISYSSLQNAISERRIGLIQELTRSLLLQRDVPSIFWPYAVKTASYLMNRRPDTVRQLSPYELLNGEAPPVDHFKVFGCLCYYNVSSDRSSAHLDLEPSSWAILSTRKVTRYFPSMRTR